MANTKKLPSKKPATKKSLTKKSLRKTGTAGKTSRKGAATKGKKLPRAGKGGAAVRTSAR